MENNLEQKLEELKETLQRFRRNATVQKNLCEMLKVILSEETQSCTDYSATQILAAASSLDTVTTEYAILATRLMITVGNDEDNDSIQTAARDTVEYLQAVLGGLRAYIRETFDPLINISEDIA